MGIAIEVALSERQRTILSGWVRNRADTSYRLVERSRKASLWLSARASIGEAATAIHILAVEGRAPGAEAKEVRSLLSRAMQMLARLLQPR